VSYNDFTVTVGFLFGSSGNLGVLDALLGSIDGFVGMIDEGKIWLSSPAKLYQID
jgi:hypothetical protein